MIHILHPEVKAAIDNLQAAIARVRELHQSIFEPIMESQIGAHWCTGCDEPYPCSTIKALDGEQ